MASLTITMSENFPARFVFLNNISYKATPEIIKREVGKLVCDSPAQIPLVRVKAFHGKRGFNGTAVVEFVSPLQALTRLEFDYLQHNLYIMGLKVHVKQDRGEKRNTDGTFVFKDVHQNRNLDGCFGKIHETRILDCNFLAKLGVVNEFKRTVVCGPMPYSAKALAVTYLECCGRLSREVSIAHFKQNNLEDGIYLLATYMYNLEALQAVSYLHGRLAVMPGMVCCTKFKTQFEPLLLIKRGLGSNGIILDIEGQMHSKGYIDILTVNKEVVRKDISVDQRCAICKSQLLAIGFHPNYEYWILNCSQCNPNRQPTTLVKSNLELTERTYITERIPQLQLCYPNVSSYIQTYTRFLEEEKKAESEALLQYKCAAQIINLKIIENITLHDKQYRILLIYLKVLENATYDAYKHRHITISSLNFDEHNGKLMTGNIVQSSNSNQLVIRVRTFGCKFVLMEEVIITPNTPLSSYQNLKCGLESIFEYWRLPLLKHIMFPSLLTKQHLQQLEPISENMCSTTLYKRLNTEQAQALRESWKSSFYCVIGPPGTGKTDLAATTAILHASEYDGGKVLICTASNNAANEVAAKIFKLLKMFQKSALQVLRVYSESEELRPRCTIFPVLSEQVAERCRSDKRMAILKEEAGEIEVFEYSSKQVVKYDCLLSEIEYDIIQETNILVCTAQTAANGKLKNQSVNLLIMEEAGQILDPLVLSAFFAGGKLPRRLYLFGDYKQLKPCVKSDSCRKAGYAQSLLEKHAKAFHNINSSLTCQLNMQYRMHPTVGNLVSSVFYDSTLTHAAELSMTSMHNCLDDMVIQALHASPLMLVDHKCYRESSIASSFCNRGEAMVVIRILKKLLSSGYNGKDIGVLTFYEAQSVLIRQLLLLAFNDTIGVEVANVDGYQGREKGVIIISCVRSNTLGQLGFLKEANRINVAISRARGAVIIVGSSTTLEGDPVWCQVLSYYKLHGSVITAEQIIGDEADESNWRAEK